MIRVLRVLVKSLEPITRILAMIDQIDQQPAADLFRPIDPLARSEFPQGDIHLQGNDW